MGALLQMRNGIGFWLISGKPSQPSGSLTHLTWYVFAQQYSSYVLLHMHKLSAVKKNSLKKQVCCKCLIDVPEN